MAAAHTQLVVEAPAKVVGTFHSTHSMSLQRSAALPFTAWPPFHDYGWCGPYGVVPVDAAWFLVDHLLLAHSRAACIGPLSRVELVRRVASVIGT